MLEPAWNIRIELACQKHEWDVPLSNHVGGSIGLFTFELDVDWQRGLLF